VDTESVVTALLNAMADGSRAVLTKAVYLRGQPGWSSVAYEFEAGRSYVGDPSSVDTMVDVDLHGLILGPWIEAYVDGQLEGVGNVAWRFEAIRDDGAWRVNRSLEIEGETGTECPEVVSKTTADLAASMVVLIEELLSVPVRT
jgi:hypothetical protein